MRKYIYSSLSNYKEIPELSKYFTFSGTSLDALYDSLNDFTLTGITLSNIIGEDPIICYGGMYYSETVKKCLPPTFSARRFNTGNPPTKLYTLENYYPNVMF